MFRRLLMILTMATLAAAPVACADNAEDNLEEAQDEAAEGDMEDAAEELEEADRNLQQGDTTELLN